MSFKRALEEELAEALERFKDESDSEDEDFVYKLTYNDDGEIVPIQQQNLPEADVASSGRCIGDTIGSIAEEAVACTTSPKRLAAAVGTDTSAINSVTLNYQQLMSRPICSLLAGPSERG